MLWKQLIGVQLMYSILSNILTSIMIIAYYSYKTLLFIHRLGVCVIRIIDKIVEAVMKRTVYRLSDTQRKVIMHILLLVGVGIVRELSS